jgi:hypothetical protein
LTKKALNPETGQCGTREQERQSEACPNDGTMMVFVTYREQLEVYAERLKEEFDIIVALKKDIRDREAANIELLRECRALRADVEYITKNRDECAAVIKIDRDHELTGPMGQCGCPSCNIHRRYRSSGATGGNGENPKVQEAV